ncbi:hypothetical protein [Acanthopleuribacter pedis]|uniref:Uncharacterized protein n=1 Tax=Acanthopleuribacter pedis TaxID=442870 RepID=A0A8J7U6N5_9BACT|nr:hypothetical protein [Acanthopleuribacter pedis]MBO1320571.1 hypothetical protein [Acanthopleuribacter pedis]
MSSLIERLQLNHAVTNLHRFGSFVLDQSRQTGRGFVRLFAAVRVLGQRGSALQWTAMVTSVFLFAGLVLALPIFALWLLRLVLLGFLAVGLWYGTRLRRSAAVVRANKAPVYQRIEHHARAYAAWFGLLQVGLPLLPLLLANLLLLEGRFSLLPLLVAAAAVGAAAYACTGWGRRPDLLGICWQQERLFSSGAAWHVGLRYQQAARADLAADNSRLQHLANLMERADPSQQIPRLPMFTNGPLRGEVRLRLPRLLLVQLLAILLILPPLLWFEPAWIPGDFWPQPNAQNVLGTPGDPDRQSEAKDDSEQREAQQEGGGLPGDQTAPGDAAGGRNEGEGQSEQGETRDGQSDDSGSSDQNSKPQKNGESANKNSPSSQNQQGRKNASQGGGSGESAEQQRPESGDGTPQKGEAGPNGQATEQRPPADASRDEASDQGNPSASDEHQPGDTSRDQTGEGSGDPSGDQRQSGDQPSDPGEKSAQEPGQNQGNPSEDAAENGETTETTGGDAEKGSPSDGEKAEPGSPSGQQSGAEPNGDAPAQPPGSSDGGPSGAGNPSEEAPTKGEGSGGNGAGQGSGDQAGGGSGGEITISEAEAVVADVPRAGDQTIEIDIPPMMQSGNGDSNPDSNAETPEPTPKERRRVAYREGRRATETGGATQPLPAWVAELLKDHRAVNAPNQPSKKQ